jgi:hypothetical protein
MVAGHFPTYKLLQHYGLDEYKGISATALRGDLKAFDRELDVNMDYFVSLGVFICLEKLRLMTLRNFVKRVAIAVD